VRFTWCDFLAMSLRILFVAFLLVFAVSAPDQLLAQNKDTDPVYKIRGYIDAHWEYPSLISKDIPEHHVVPFLLLEPKWDKKYNRLSPVNPSNKNPACLKISGIGHLRSRDPDRRPNDKYFIFTKVFSLQIVPSLSHCTAQDGTLLHG
jgi:hypothetical protein